MTSLRIVEVWPSSQPGDVVSQVESFIRKYCVLPAAAYLAISLWVIATYLVRECFDAFPYLAILSPVKRCGKSRLQEVLEMLCLRAWRGIAPSPASLYRMMENCPCLFIDEFQILRGKQLSESQQAILAVLLAGHRRGATVPRCDGKDHKLIYFPVFGPKCLAGTTQLPDHLADRSILVAMQRKTKMQQVERFLFRRAKAAAESIVEEITKWAAANDERVQIAYESIEDLHFLSDRDGEIWSSLFAVCSVAAPERIKALMEDAKTLCKTKQANDEDDSLPLRLLADLISVWKEYEINLTTAAILDRLQQVEESPWKSDIELTPRKLARMLRPFGMERRQVREKGSESTTKGYLRSELEQAVSCYLPSSDKKIGNIGNNPHEY